MDSCFPPLASLSLRENRKSAGAVGRSRTPSSHSPCGASSVFSSSSSGDETDNYGRIEILQDLEVYYIKQIAHNYKVRARSAVPLSRSDGRYVSPFAGFRTGVLPDDRHLPLWRKCLSSWGWDTEQCVKLIHVLFFRCVRSLHSCSADVTCSKDTPACVGTEALGVFFRMFDRRRSIRRCDRSLFRTP
ncbi:hypothetical protein J437_LFUL004286 [Ladona fulva]|uniref:Uncharacterized protein n=1 Tax=Ladona fulva TaxID=123851 RepID=A0A8K0NTR1_LADFU|nr:hypothetical protein J437_LFUL004286 [Ladona fulva]